MNPRHEPPASRTARGGRRSRWLGVRWGLRIVAAALSLTVLVGSGYAWGSFRNFSTHVTTVDAIVPVPTPATGSEAAASAVAENILLVGDDHRPSDLTAAQLAQLSTTEDGGGLNTDTMMVMHIPAGGGKATVVSLPRDTWLPIPGNGMAKLNAAFEYGSDNGGGDAGGARLLIQVIETLTGVTIDHFVRVSMLGFYQIAQVMGPITVCLNEAAVDSYSGTNLPAGVSYLDPQQALSFVRQRHNLPHGDLDREIRQQYFLSSALSTLESAGILLNPFKLQSLLSAVSSALETDPGLDLLAFAQQFANLGTGNVTYATIPVTGTPTITYDGSDVSIVSVDPVAVRAFMTSLDGPPAAYAAAKAVPPSSVTVTVLNGSGTNGAAAVTTATLAQLGFRAQVPGSTDPAAATTIEYPAGMEAQAKTLAGDLPGAAVTLSTTVSSVTVVLGADGLAAVDPPGVSAGPTAPAGPAAPTVSSTAPTHEYTSTQCID